MITPNRHRIYEAAWQDARTRGLSAAAAHRFASAEYERAKAEYRRSGRSKPERPTPAPDGEQLTEALCDPAARAGLYEVAPWVRTILASQVGPRPTAVQALTGATTKWDEQVLLNEFLILRRDDDPRELLKDKALQLAEEMQIDFLAALEDVKRAEPELVERASAFRPWDPR